MLRIEVDGIELFDERTGKFTNFTSKIVYFEHSLLAISKWESKYQVPFLDQRGAERTAEQVLDYLEAMIIPGHRGVKPTDDLLFLKYLPRSAMEQINKYIESNESATTFPKVPGSNRAGGGEIITSELVYYWMVAFSIPFDCESWNINRLFALVKICNIKNSPSKKMPRHEVAAQNRDLNAERKKQLGTTG